MCVGRTLFCSPGCPKTHPVHQAGLSLTEIYCLPVPRLRDWRQASPQLLPAYFFETRSFTKPVWLGQMPSRLLGYWGSGPQSSLQIKHLSTHQAISLALVRNFVSEAELYIILTRVLFFHLHHKSWTWMKVKMPWHTYSLLFIHLTIYYFSVSMPLTIRRRFTDMSSE